MILRRNKILKNKSLNLLVQIRGMLFPEQKRWLKILKLDIFFNSHSMDVYITKSKNHLKDDDLIEIVNIHG